MVNLDSSETVMAGGIETIASPWVIVQIRPSE
jgi:hypothetical protein